MGRLLPFISAAASAAAVLLLTLPSSALVSAQFSSNVVSLTDKNWAQEVLDSPHPVFVNICRSGCGYCQQLAPEWERLAKAVKGTAKIAYWDSEQQGGRPRLLGEVKGTPTIRLYTPKKKQGNSERKKIVTDYQFERKAVDMKKWLDQSMNSFVERIKGEEGMQGFEAKAGRNGLPQAILFTSKASTMSLTKFLSVEFRRRLLLGEVHPTKPNGVLLERFGVTETPALLVFPPASVDADASAGQPEPILYEGEFTRRKLHSFLSGHALKEAVFPPSKPKADEADAAADAAAAAGAPKEKVKVEL